MNTIYKRPIEKLLSETLVVGYDHNDSPMIMPSTLMEAAHKIEQMLHPTSDMLERKHCIMRMTKNEFNVAQTAIAAMGDAAPSEQASPVITSEISVKSVFTDEENLKAQISKERLEQMRAHCDEGNNKWSNETVQELLDHIRAIEKVRDEWCMEYVRLRDSKPVSVSLEKCHRAAEEASKLKLSKRVAKAVLDVAGVMYVD